MPYYNDWLGRCLRVAYLVESEYTYAYSILESTYESISSHIMITSLHEGSCYLYGLSKYVTWRLKPTREKLKLSL